GGNVTNSVTYTHSQAVTLVSGRRIYGAPKITRVTAGNANLVVSGFSIVVEGFNTGTSSWENISRQTGPRTYSDTRTVASITVMNPTGSNQNANSALAFVTEIYEGP
ncbi:MAG: hypothetical protein SFU83_14940, partial [Meiothermus sp.]|nr:hypothetical protein [Meiothermus sp.]